MANPGQPLEQFARGSIQDWESVLANCHPNNDKIIKSIPCSCGAPKLIEPTIVELTDPDSDLVEQALALYEAAFPVEERAPLVYLYEDMRWRAQGNRQPDHVRHFLAAVESGRLVGICMYSYYRDYRLAFLGYLATLPELRGNGLGAWLLKRTVGLLSADAELLGGLPPLGMCWEVERPLNTIDPFERNLRERRIQFYQRNGAILLKDIQLTAPPLGEGLPPVAYHLMFLPVNAEEVIVDQALELAAIQAAILGAYGLDQESEYYRQAVASIRESEG